MILIGLTGSIGMGKSTVAKMFAEAGVPVFDADAEVHRLQGPGGALVNDIEAMFAGTTGPEGVNRALLGKAVLGDPVALAKLEALIHPAVGAARESFLVAHGHHDLIVFDIPLLFERGGNTRVDATVVVSAGRQAQRARVLARPGMSPERFESILKLQLPDADKRARADFVVDTGTSLAATRAAVESLIACLRAHGVRYCRACARSSSIPKPPA